MMNFSFPLFQTDLPIFSTKQKFIWLLSRAGLPDFSRHNIPKQVKIYQIATKLPNGHKMYQMGIE
jgi:hypothetical protein